MSIMDEREDMEVNEAAVPAESVSQYFGSAQELVHRYQHCVICGGNLHFSYLTDFSRNLAEETARCPECGVRARRVTHRLQ